MKYVFNLICACGYHAMWCLAAIKLWAWFIAPRFALGPLGFFEAAGMYVCINLALAGMHIGQFQHDLSSGFEEKFGRKIDGQEHGILSNMIGLMIAIVAIGTGYLWHILSQR